MLKKIGIILVVLIVLIFSFATYMGLFKTMNVYEKEMGPYTFVYESFVGPYAETGPVYNKVYSELKKMGIESEKGLGVYYDDPSKVEAAKLRSECGLVLNKDDYDRIDEIKKKFMVKEIKKKISIVTEFPTKNPLSYMFGPMKAYPALMDYIKINNYSILSSYELYDEPAKKTYYVMPVVK